MARSSGDTLSLKHLGTAVRTTDTGSGVSLNACNASAGTQISLDDFGIDDVTNSIGGGYTYLVESTAETYNMAFGEAGSGFESHIRNKSANFTWSVTPSYNSNAASSGYLSLESNADYTNQITAGAMNPQGAGSQTSLSSTTSHTVSATFADGFNDHATRYNTAVTKVVYSVDTYDGNTALCLTSDSPVLKADGTIVEVGELEEGDILDGYALAGLSEDSDSDFLEWSSEILDATPKEVTVVSVIYSFAQRYYNINDGELTATGEHPFLVKDVVSGDYKFKEVLTIEEGDKLIKKGTAGLEEIEVTSKVAVNETTEIVSIDVEQQDTYLVNGYVTHNKGANTFSGDLSASSAPTGLTYSSPSVSWTAPSSSGDTGITGYDFQIDNDSNFGSLIADVTEWSTTSVEVLVGYSLSPGTTYYFRVRAIDHGLKSAWASFSFTA